MEYTDQEQIVHEDDGEGGWVDTHPSTEATENSGTADMSNDDKVWIYWTNSLEKNTENNWK